MSALAMAISAPPFGDAASLYLSDEFMTAWERAPRGPLEERSRGVLESVERLALDGPGADVAEWAFAYDSAARIAFELGALRDAEAFHRASIAALVSSTDGLSALTLALFASLGLGRVERAAGHFDDALYRFERLAALPLGGSFEGGPLVVTPALFQTIARFAPSLPDRLASAALAEAIETLIVSRRYDLALAVARIRDARDPAWLDTLRREATATALSRMGHFREALVFLSSAAFREPALTRPIFEQKRAETLAASGQLEAAAARSSFVAEVLVSRFRNASASLDDLVLACRACRTLAMLGQTEESSTLAVHALPFAEGSGDVPLSIELASRVVPALAPPRAPPRAQDGATNVLASSPLEGEAPSFSRLRDRLLSLTP